MCTFKGTKAQVAMVKQRKESGRSRGGQVERRAVLSGLGRETGVKVHETDGHQGPL